MKSGVFDLRSESRTFTSHPPKSLLVLKTDKNTLKYENIIIVIHVAMII
jgi:hypothetical protein